MQYVDLSPRTPNSALYTIGPWFASLRHSAREQTNHQIMSYNHALLIVGREINEITMSTRERVWAGKLIRMSDRRLPKRMVLGSLEGAVPRGRGGNEKEWDNCVQSNIQAFGIAGRWEATALEEGVWTQAVTEGGCGDFLPRGGKRWEMDQTSPGEEKGERG